MKRVDTHGLSARRYFFWYKSRFEIFRFLEHMGISCRCHWRSQEGISGRTWDTLPTSTLRVDMRWHASGLGDGPMVGADDPHIHPARPFQDPVTAVFFILNHLGLDPKKFTLPSPISECYPSPEDLDTLARKAFLPQSIIIPASFEETTQLLVQAVRANVGLFQRLLPQVPKIKGGEALRTFEQSIREVLISLIPRPPAIVSPSDAPGILENLLEEHASLEAKIEAAQREMLPLTDRLAEVRKLLGAHERHLGEQLSKIRGRVPQLEQ